MNYGFVYCLEHHKMPGLYKVGHTYKSPHQRAIDLSRATGVPDEFSVVGYIEVDKPEVWERRFHRYLDEYRQNAKREFFCCDLWRIAPLFLRNEWAAFIADLNFAPCCYPVMVDELPNPYLECPWLALEP